MHELWDNLLFIMLRDREHWSLHEKKKKTDVQGEESDRKSELFSFTSWFQGFQESWPHLCSQVKDNASHIS